MVVEEIVRSGAIDGLDQQLLEYDVPLLQSRNAVYVEIKKSLDEWLKLPVFQEILGSRLGLRLDLFYNEVEHTIQIGKIKQGINFDFLLKYHNNLFAINHSAHWLFWHMLNNCKHLSPKVDNFNKKIKIEQYLFFASDVEPNLPDIQSPTIDLKTILQRHNLKECKQVGDGHCLISSFVCSCQHAGIDLHQFMPSLPSEFTNMQFRQAFVELIMTKQNLLFDHFIQRAGVSDLNVSQKTSILSALKNWSNSNQWTVPVPNMPYQFNLGDLMCSLISNVLGIEMEIFEAADSKRIHILLEPTDSNPTNPYPRIPLLHRQNHYDCLAPVKEKMNQSS